MENSVFAYYIHTLRVGTDPVFMINTDSLYFRKKQGLYTLCTTLYFREGVFKLSHKEIEHQ